MKIDLRTEIPQGITALTFDFTLTKNSGDDANNVPLTAEGIRQNTAKILRKSMAGGNTEFWLDLRSDGIQCTEGTYVAIKNIVEAASMTLYSYKGYHKEAIEEKDYLIHIVVPDLVSFYDQAIDAGTALAGGVNMARNMINEPANKFTPETMADMAREMASGSNITVEVYDEAWLKENKFECLLAVGRASEFPPRLIVMTYTGAGEDKPYTAVVGKGVTFDSGGYNLKQSEGLEFMKVDMGGAAAVMGLMQVVSAMNPKINLIAAIPACENMIGGKAYRAGDIISAYSETTIEVVNTDAEGRLILADTLAWLSEMENVERMIDVATLTGNSMIVFGGLYASLLTNSDSLHEQLKTSSDRTAENLWRLPLDPGYKAYLASEVADTKNTMGKKYAGSILGGIFLEQFVGDKEWAHIDMSSVNASMMPKGYNPKGPKGFGVRLLYDYLDRFVKMK